MKARYNTSFDNSQFMTYKDEFEKQKTEYPDCVRDNDIKSKYQRWKTHYATQQFEKWWWQDQTESQKSLESPGEKIPNQ